MFVHVRKQLKLEECGCHNVYMYMYLFAFNYACTCIIVGLSYCNEEQEQS